MIDSISHRHVGTQQMIVKDNSGSDALTIPLDLSRCSLPITEEIGKLKNYC
jgi:hypothetical protein